MTTGGLPVGLTPGMAQMIHSSPGQRVLQFIAVMNARRLQILLGGGNDNVIVM